MRLFFYYSHPTLWRPEYGSYMIEGTPGQPYGGTMSEFNTVQDNMRKRRQEAASVLKENEAVCTVTSFPRWGGCWRVLLLAILLVCFFFLMHIAKLYNETQQNTFQLKYFDLMFHLSFLKFLLQWDKQMIIFYGFGLLLICDDFVLGENTRIFVALSIVCRVVWHLELMWQIRYKSLLFYLFCSLWSL